MHLRVQGSVLQSTPPSVRWMRRYMGRAARQDLIWTMDMRSGLQRLSSLRLSFAQDVASIGLELQIGKGACFSHEVDLLNCEFRPAGLQLVNLDAFKMMRVFEDTAFQLEECQLETTFLSACSCKRRRPVR
jgi:hypothetical protein